MHNMDSAADTINTKTLVDALERHFFSRLYHIMWCDVKEYL